jgi:hypothetical protein
MTLSLQVISSTSQAIQKTSQKVFSNWIRKINQIKKRIKACKTKAMGLVSNSKTLRKSEITLRLMIVSRKDLKNQIKSSKLQGQRDQSPSWINRLNKNKA